jgi:hypothetical protein
MNILTVLLDADYSCTVMALFHWTEGYSREVMEHMGKWGVRAHKILYDAQWRTEGGGFGGLNPLEIPKLGQIPRSVENKSVTT